jgi:DNA-3-methyladenine glycosylase
VLNFELSTILEAGAVKAARQLIGWQLYTVEPDGTKVGGTIIETEAYTQNDAASHTFGGQTARNGIMFNAAGHIYVYFTYGMHWCFNIVTGQVGQGEAVLVRALAPKEGIGIMRDRRKNVNDALLTNGPAKLCQALAITGQDNGALVNTGRFLLQPPSRTHKITTTPRIGIKKDTQRLWRFVTSDS